MSKARSLIAASVDVVPVAMARQLLTPPPSEADKEKPLFVYLCPHCARLKLLPEALTNWPAVVHCHSRPVILLKGSELFVGDHLWKGYPDALPDRLLTVLDRVYELDETRGQLGLWQRTPAVYASWEPLRHVLDTAAAAQPVPKVPELEPAA